VHVLAQKLRTAELTIEHCDSENEQLNKKMCDDRATLNDRIMEFQRKNAALEGKVVLCIYHQVIIDLDLDYSTRN
jgi:hypothetical protein